MHDLYSKNSTCINSINEEIICFDNLFWTRKYCGFRLHATFLITSDNLQHTLSVYDNKIRWLKRYCTLDWRGGEASWGMVSGNAVTQVASRKLQQLPAPPTLASPGSEWGERKLCSFQEWLQGSHPAPGFGQLGLHAAAPASRIYNLKWRKTSNFIN